MKTKKRKSFHRTDLFHQPVEPCPPVHLSRTVICREHSTLSGAQYSVGACPVQYSVGAAQVAPAPKKLSLKELSKTIRNTPL